MKPCLLLLLIISSLLPTFSVAQYRETKINGTTAWQAVISPAKNSAPIPASPMACDCPKGHAIGVINGACNAVDDKAFVKIYRTDFSFLVAAADNATILDQLVVRIDKPSVGITKIWMSKKKRRVISGGFSLKAGVEDDLSTLFSDGKWNATFTFGPRLNLDLFNLFDPKNQQYFFEPKDLETMKCRIGGLNANLEERELKIRFKLDSLKTLRSVLVGSGSPLSTGVKAKINLAIDSLSTLLDPDELNTFNQGQLNDVQLAMKWSAKRHLWLSFAPDFAPRSINIFDATNKADSMITEKNLLVSTFPITINYSEAGRLMRPSYVSASWVWERTNDLLNETYRHEYVKEIVKYSDSLGTAPKTLYKNTEKKTFYSGNNQMLLNKRINLQYIQFFNTKQTIGGTVNLAYFMPDSRSKMNRNYANLGVGLIVPAIMGDGKSKLNIVGTLTLNDISGVVEQWNVDEDPTYIRKSWDQRLALTVRVGLPISMLSNK